jgi:WD40 repeat protein
MVRLLRVARFGALVVLLLSTFGVSCASAQVAVQTSHVGAVNAIAYHEETAAVVSAGSDGRLKVWSAEREQIVRSHQAGSHPLVALTVHPERPEAAVVSSRGPSAYRLEVIDWGDGERRFSVTLEARPLVLQYSPSGRFILLAESRLSGMRYFDAETGRELDYPAVPQGIVTYATVAGSERTIMTYVAADGSIRYWNLEDRRVIADADTLPELRHMQVLENKRFAAAVHDGDLVVVDIVEGATMDRVSVGDVEYLTVAEGSGEIVLLETRAAGRRVSLWEFDGSFLERGEVHWNSDLSRMTAVTLAGDKLYGGSEHGELYLFRSSGRPQQQLVEDVVEPIHDVALSGDTLFINVSGRIHAIVSDYFVDPAEGLPDVENVESLQVENPVDAPVYMRTLKDGRILLWGTEGEAASTLYVARPRDLTRRFGGGFEEVLSLDAEFHEIIEFDDTVLVLTSSDTLFQYDARSFEQVFRHSALGMETVVGTNRYGIVVGKSRTSSFDSAVLTIDPVTRETVPLQTEAFLVYDVAYDEAADYLYALGITRGGGGRTVVTRFSGAGDLSRRETIFDVAGEYLDGNLAVDPVNGDLYTSVGDSGITRITDGEVETYARSSHASRRIEVSDRYIWALNRDGSVTLWNPERAEIVGDIYFFTDGGWALVTNGGRFYASSPQAEEFVAAVSEDDTTESLRLTLPEQ